MGLERYLDKDEAMKALEKASEVFVEDVLFPALDRVVADSSNPFDDMALQQAKPLIRAALDKIDGNDQD